MNGAGADFEGVAQFDDLAEVHHGYAVADMADDGDVVGDEEHRQAELLLERQQQIENLGLDRDIERGDRLVGDEEIRLGGQGTGDRDPLPLSAAEGMGKAALVRRSQPDHLQQFADAVIDSSPSGHLMKHERLADDVADVHARVQG